MKYFRKIQKFVSFVLLFALLTVMYNNITNQHCHFLPNGQMVVHAHPFSKTGSNEPQKQHRHNTNQFLVISLINNLFAFLLFISFIFSFILQIRNKKTGWSDNEKIFLLPAVHFQLRAPPIS